MTCEIDIKMVSLEKILDFHFIMVLLGEMSLTNEVVSKSTACICGSKGRGAGTRAPSTTLSSFQCIFWERMANNRLAHPFGVGYPVWEILDPPLAYNINAFCLINLYASFLGNKAILQQKLGIYWPLISKTV